MENSWVHKTLGELFVFKNGLNKGKEYFGYGTPIINYMDVYKHPAIKKKYVQGRVTLSHQELDRFRVLKGDVFFTRTSETPEEVGMSATLLEDIPNCSFSGFVLRARPLTDLLIPEYCVYAFTAKEIRASIIKNCTYTTRALTNGRVLASLKLPIPSLAEQQRIASALSDADALVAELDVLIEKKRAIMAGTMQELLTGKRRLQGYNEKWKESAIEDIGNLIRGVSFDSDSVSTSFFENSIPILRANNIVDGNLFLHDLIFVDKHFVKKHQYHRENDILICSANGSKRLVGKAALIKGDDNISFGAFMTTLRCKNASMALYFSMFMRTDEYRKQINDLLCGSAINNLNSKQLYTIKLKHPSDQAEQRAIASILSDMDAEIAELEAKRDKYKEVRQGMMQQLLTGKIRLI